MNSAINKTFYTCSTESFLLRNKKIFKKAVKLVSFVQCLGHIFLGHDGGFWKIKLRILWNHIMKNFQIKHGQCDSIIFPETSSFESFKQLLDFSFAGSRIRYFWQVLESIHKFIIELHVLQCSFVRRGRVISNFTKGENFDLLWQPSPIGGNLTIRPPSCTLQKIPLPPFHFGQDENIRGDSNERKKLFWKLPGCSLFPQLK